MPTYVSDHRGRWHAAKEKVGGLVYKGDKSIPKDKLPDCIKIVGDILNPGDPFIYDGPDREALKELRDQGYDLPSGERVIGTDFTHNPEFLQSLRTMGFKDVKEYLNYFGYDDKKAENDFNDKADKVMAHEVEKRVDAIEVLAGGRNTAGGGDEDLIGGFGPERERKASEVKKVERMN